MAQGLRSPALLSFRGLHAANAKLVITTNLRLQAQATFKAEFSTARLANLSGLRGGCWSQRRPLSGVTSRRQPFDPRFFSSNASQAAAVPAELPVLSPPAVGIWLLASSALVFAVIVVGGVTRLTESGLSITEWKPVSGILPPLSREQWEEEFYKYKQTPEFKLYVL